MTEEKSGGSFLETVKTVIYAVLIAVVLRTFAYEPFTIPSGSMLPTLQIGDYLFVSKFSYGYSHFSLPFGWPPFRGRVLADEQPVERGDVAVFVLPRDGKTDYIKRIIGLPGDTIQVREGRLYINGEQVERELVEDDLRTDASGFPQTVTAYRETLPNGVSHMIWERDDRSSLDNTPVFTVPEDHYFAMGDNRDNSQDSRTSRVGFVPRENLIGRAEFLFFSVDGSARLWEVWKWPSAIRWDRLFHGIG